MLLVELVVRVNVCCFGYVFMCNIFVVLQAVITSCSSVKCFIHATQNLIVVTVTHRTRVGHHRRLDGLPPRVSDERGR